MYLSNRLTFSLFSVLLVAALVVVPTAMASVTVTAYQTVTDSTTTTAETIVITLTYSEDVNPRPALNELEAGDGQISQPDDGDGDREQLVASYSDNSNNAITVAIGGSGKIVTITFTGPVNVDISLPTQLQLLGYSTDLANVQISTAEAIADGTNTPTSLALDSGYIAGKAYVVYVRGTDVTTASAPAPHLPANIRPDGSATPARPSANSQVLRTIFTGTGGNSNVAMPDLEDFFWVGGGTIDLNVPSIRSNHLIINEVMWAVDDRLVGEAGHTNQQWIEVYNRLTKPAPPPRFVFTNNPSGLNPPPPNRFPAASKDRLSNIPSFVNTWNVKGQNGSSIVNDADTPAIIGANPVFKSMYRKPDKQNADGSNAGHWEVSERPYLAGFYGTPGSANTRGVVATARPAPTAANPAMDKVLINEVYDAKGGDGNNMNDWLELRALKRTNLKNWMLSYVDGAANNNNGVADEHEIFRFPNADRWIEAGDIWLIVNKDPTTAGMRLAAGNDVTIGEAANRPAGRGDAKYLIVDNFNIPTVRNGDILLILRSRNDRKASRANLEDVIGTGTFSKWTRNLATAQREPHTGNPGQIWDTKIFPLNGQNPPDPANNNPNSLLANDLTFRAGTAWYRLGNNKGWLRDGGRHHGNRGGIGYDRAWSGNADAAGTPGYPNDAYKEFAAAAADNVYISEIMYAHDGTAQSPPQWIELHNPSRTASVNLGNFRMTIKNHDQTLDADGMLVNWVGDPEGTFVLSGMSIPPGETVLIVTAAARRDKISIPAHRIFNIFRTTAAKNALGMKTRGDNIFNPYGFSITLNVKNAGNDGNYSRVADTFGNLADPESDRRGSRERFDPIRWTIQSGYNEDGERVSIARRRNKVQGLTDGRTASSWILSSHDGRVDKIDIVYYGSKDDISTPGQTVGSPLPVELSFFRPKSENGKVTIQWTTESELDNAGFNIHRSETHDGEFKQVNEQMIQGKGTTAERSTYKWVDTTAKPGAVYYYQIEDVSFAGEHNTLGTTKLKGLISAKGKLTTSWGDIKNASQ